MLEKIIFKGYKSFKEKYELELKPITILFGKNSSGKSSLVKLPTLIEGALSMKFEEPLRFINKGIELGAEYRDLFYQREYQSSINFQLYQNKNKLDLSIVNSSSEKKVIITNWYFECESYKKNISTEQLSKYSFKGFLTEQNLSSKCFSLKTNYLGPFRIKPKRIFYINSFSNSSSIGKKGAIAYDLIAKDEELETKVSEWFKNNFDGWELFVDRKTPYYEIKIRRDSKSEAINIVDVGQGMSQSLPIIIKALSDYNNDDTLNIIEQPELHLHPAAHGNLAELIFNSYKNYNQKYLIETHSENFILRLRTLIAKGNLDINDINLYFVDFDEKENSSSLRKIKIDTLGDVDDWPEEIFNESFEETKALIKAQKEK
ncbi:AAA family ATPase [Tenacibaculum sp. 190524A02b]|uniref:AAA family ATPase n=1 Tax=Tenacibaculum vairaonense TaxID=3137860 RepID=UPI0031FB6A11